MIRSGDYSDLTYCLTLPRLDRNKLTYAAPQLRPPITPSVLSLVL